MRTDSWSTLLGVTRGYVITRRPNRRYKRDLLRSFSRRISGSSMRVLSLSSTGWKNSWNQPKQSLWNPTRLLLTFPRQRLLLSLWIHEWWASLSLSISSQFTVSSLRTWTSSTMSCSLTLKWCISPNLVWPCLHSTTGNLPLPWWTLTPVSILSMASYLSRILAIMLLLLVSRLSLTWCTDKGAIPPTNNRRGLILNFNGEIFSPQFPLERDELHHIEKEPYF